MNKSSTELISVIKSALPTTLKTAWWMVRLTVTVTFSVSVLKYFGVIDAIAEYMSPFFRLMGLPGDASLVFITGYFVNVYSAIAVMATLTIDLRSVTILAVMCLCAHSMIIETAVQKKTGSSAVRMIFVRTFYAILSGFVLNLLLPENPALIETAHVENAVSGFRSVLTEWAIAATELSVKMFVIIVVLNVVQRILSEYGVIAAVSGYLSPLMRLFGLPAGLSFLWVVANILGLSYGAAVMIEECRSGKIERKDADLLNYHIGISHSNFEDMMLFFFAGASIPWMLFLRWFFSGTAVWLRRSEIFLRNRFSGRDVKNI